MILLYIVPLAMEIGRFWKEQILQDIGRNFGDSYIEKRAGEEYNIRVDSSTPFNRAAVGSAFPMAARFLRGSPAVGTFGFAAAALKDSKGQALWRRPRRPLRSIPRPQAEKKPDGLYCSIFPLPSSRRSSTDVYGSEESSAAEVLFFPGLFVLRFISLSVWLCAHAARAPPFLAEGKGGKVRLRGKPLSGGFPP